MKRLLIFACCLAALGCHPDLDGFGAPAQKDKPAPKPKSERQLRNEALKKSLHEFNAYVDSIRTVGLVKPDVLLYEMTPGGVGEVIEDWCEQAGGRLVESVTEELKARNITVKPVKPVPGDKARLASAKYLFRAISEGLGWNDTPYRKTICPDIQVCPDYALGPVDQLFKESDVEALLLVLAMNNIPAPEPPPAPERVEPEPPAERVATAPGEAGTGKKKKKGSTTYALINGKPVRTGTYLSMALVDRHGNILWYGGKATRKDADLRTRASADEMTALVLGLLRAKETK